MRKVSSENKWFNIAAFQIVWWSMVYLKNAAVPIGLAFLIFHITFLKSSRKNEVFFLLAAAIAGVVVDSGLGFFGVIDFYPERQSPVYWPPIWLVVLWFCFVATLRHSLKWVFKRAFVYLPAGSLGGGLTYFSADQLGALDLMSPVSYSMTILFLVWGGLFSVFRYFFVMFQKKS